MSGRQRAITTGPLTFGVVGYSTRALVQAVVDLGHQAVAIDAFGDEDTLELARSIHVVEDWPHGIMTAARAVQVDAWLLGGGIENCSEILGALTNNRANYDNARMNAVQLNELAPVFGPDTAVMNQMRSVEFWQTLCDDPVHGKSLCFPETRWTAPPSPGRDWLIKSRRGGGGLGVLRHQFSNELERYEHGWYYWQRYIEGRVLGVTWLLHDRTARLIGVTQALDANDWPGPTEFIYRGSIGPITLRRAQWDALQMTAERVLTALPEYRGYLQADIVEDDRGQLWLLELNPRWTAGMEILHDASLRLAESPLAEHLRAWGVGPAVEHSCNRTPSAVVSKAVHYAAQDIELTQSDRRRLDKLRNWEDTQTLSVQWCLADVPAVAPSDPMRFERGSPILTVKCRRLAE